MYYIQYYDKLCYLGRSSTDKHLKESLEQFLKISQGILVEFKIRNNQKESMGKCQYDTLEENLLISSRESLDESMVKCLEY